MTQHTSLLWLPAALRQAGVQAIELDGWDEAQGNYKWTNPHTGHQSYDEDPSSFMIHHTAGSVATPSVQDGSGTWSKANLWAGLWDGRRLHQTAAEGRTPALVFVSAGPARVSSGYGNWPTAEQVFADIIPPWKQTGSDGDKAGNRYCVNVETVAKGDGSDIDPAVEEALVIMGALMANWYGWDGQARTWGHLTFTKRKVDPYWQGEPNRIENIRYRVGRMQAEGIPGGTPPVDPPTEPEEPDVDYEQLGRDIVYPVEGQEGLVIEQWQVRIVEWGSGIKFTGNSNWSFIEEHAPELTPKRWDAALTEYLSALTGRNSYGVGPTEAIMIQNATHTLYQ